MKKSWIILLSIAIVVGISLPFIINNDKDEIEETIEFGFENSYYTIQKEGNLTFSCKSASAMDRIELLINDKLVQKWDKPKKNSFTADLSGYALGTYTLVLIGYKGNKDEYSDSRHLYINASSAPAQLTYTLKESHPHDSRNFTQGYEFYNDKLFESTGNPNNDGATKIAQIDTKTGLSIREQAQPNPIFGEGITVMNDKIYQISWQNGLCFVYDVNDFSQIDTLAYTGEGWGLCNDGKSIIMSDGTSKLTYRNPETFEITKTINIHSDLGPVTNINELEFLDGQIWANLWISEQRMQMDSRMNLAKVISIDANNGEVLAYMDIMDLFNKASRKNVPNGIAYRKSTNTFWLTGKYWNQVYEVEIEAKNI